jgi:GntR family transcriptional repressor for pyruvate dehydrogenase complex
MYSPIQSERLYQQIVEQIQRRILSGELKVGAQLPAERELAEQFQVSRTAVREAIKALREKGLVDILPGRGTFVTDGASRAMRHSLGFLVRMGGERSASLVEVREILEPEIAALAAGRATDEHMQALREIVNTMDAALENADLFVEADLDFHLALADATQNAIIPVLIDSIVDVLREDRKRTAQTPHGPAHAQQHHRRILEAISRRDADGAREAMRAHLRQVRADSAVPGA